MDEVYELVDRETGNCIYSGTKERCLNHIRNDAMTAVYPSNIADEYRDMLQQDKAIELGG